MVVAREVVAVGLAVVVGSMGYSGLGGYYLACIAFGALSGSFRASVAVALLALIPGAFIDSGFGFHADSSEDYFFAAWVVPLPGTVLALGGAFASKFAGRGARRVRGLDLEGA